MKKAADFIVKNRYITLAVLCILAMISAIMIPRVNIVTDMSKYLPDDSSMRAGMEIMEREFLLFTDADELAKKRSSSELGQLFGIDSEMLNQIYAMVELLP